MKQVTLRMTHASQFALTTNGDVFDSPQRAGAAPVWPDVVCSQPSPPAGPHALHDGWPYEYVFSIGGGTGHLTLEAWDEQGKFDERTFNTSAGLTDRRFRFEVPL